MQVKTLPLPLPFGPNRNASRVFVSANGFLTFDERSLPFYSNLPVGNLSALSTMVAPLWVDLDPSSRWPGMDSRVTLHVDDKNASVVVTWANVTLYVPWGTETEIRRFCCAACRACPSNRARHVSCQRVP